MCFIVKDVGKFTKINHLMLKIVLQNKPICKWVPFSVLNRPKWVATVKKKKKQKAFFLTLILNCQWGKYQKKKKRFLLFSSSFDSSKECSLILVISNNLWTVNICGFFAFLSPALCSPFCGYKKSVQNDIKEGTFFTWF